MDLTWSLTPLPTPAAGWQSYGQRYAIIVMGGDVSGQSYDWYWGDTYEMYTNLRSYGFSAQNIYFLSYGEGGGDPPDPDAVDAESTTDNIRDAYAWAQQVCTSEDLLYIYWVDHGSRTAFVTHDGTISHAELGTLMQPIVAKQILGAYNPCYSGAVIDDISRPGVITTTSQDADHPNSCGWAGWWVTAVDGGSAQDPSDTNGDGYVSMTEAYLWVCPRSQDAGEHPMYDDNGDGVGHECTDAGFDPDDPDKDGYAGTLYSLDGWYSEDGGADLIAREVWLTTDPEGWDPGCAMDSVPHDTVVYLFFQYDWTGNDTCPAHFVAFTWRGSVYEGPIPPVPPLTRVTVRCGPVSSGSQSSSVELCGEVDVYDDVPESNENNNEKCTSVEVPVSLYTVTDLGAGAAYAINDAGQVTGYEEGVDGTHYGVMWETSGGSGRVAVTYLPTLGGSDCRGMAINNAGEIAGYAETADGDNRAFLWLPEPAHGLPAGMHDLGTLGEYGPESYGYDLNDYADVVGAADTSPVRQHAFLWLPTRGSLVHPGMNDLGTLGGSDSEARGINNNGQVVGWANTYGVTLRHAFLWYNGMNDLGALPDGALSEAFAINDAGQVVGWSCTEGYTTWHAFLWLPEPAYGFPAGMNDLGTLGSGESQALAINRCGLTTGWSNTSSGERHAFLCRGPRMVDLNDLTPADSGWVLTEAWDINDAGQIVGCGERDGEMHAFLLRFTLPGDLDYDGDVDLSDLAQLLVNYGVTSGAGYEDGDLDGDGDVDLSDLARLLAVYGTRYE